MLNGRCIRAPSFRLQLLILFLFISSPFRNTRSIRSSFCSAHSNSLPPLLLSLFLSLSLTAFLFLGSGIAIMPRSFGVVRQQCDKRFCHLSYVVITIRSAYSRGEGERGCTGLCFLLYRGSPAGSLSLSLSLSLFLFPRSRKTLAEKCEQKMQASAKNFTSTAPVTSLLFKLVSMNHVHSPQNTLLTLSRRRSSRFQCAYTSLHIYVIFISEL